MEKNKPASPAGRTGKYFKYAIGEIILVVVGILIALSINNWNEDRKTTTQEIKILNELKNDLETNLGEIIETYNTTSHRQLSTVLILDYFEKMRPVDDSLKKAFENIKMAKRSSDKFRTTHYRCSRRD